MAASGVSLTERIQIDRALPVALHYQLQRQLRREIEGGALMPGEKLPSVTDLCRDLQLSVSTVSRAITELSRDGLVVARRGVGTVVAESAPLGVEVLAVNFAPERRPLHDIMHFERLLLDGLHRGLGDERRLFISYLHDDASDAAEILDVCRARRVGSLVWHRPVGRILTVARAVAARHPSVSLFLPIESPASATVLCDPGPALARLLHARHAAGKRRFAFISFPRGQRSSMWLPCSPYEKLRLALIDTVREFGLEAGEITLSRVKPDAAELKAVAGALPADAVAVCVNPVLAAGLRDFGAAYETVAYTESAFSAEQYGGRVTLLHLSPETVGFHAGRLLATSSDWFGKGEGCSVTLEPEIREPAPGT